jgi:hypothetical protein
VPTWTSGAQRCITHWPLVAPVTICVFNPLHGCDSFSPRDAPLGEALIPVYKHCLPCNKVIVSVIPCVWLPLRSNTLSALSFSTERFSPTLSLARLRLALSFQVRVAFRAAAMRWSVAAHSDMSPSLMICRCTGVMLLRRVPPHGKNASCSDREGALSQVAYGHGHLLSVVGTGGACDGLRASSARDPARHEFSCRDGTAGQQHPGHTVVP